MDRVDRHRFELDTCNLLEFSYYINLLIWAKDFDEQD